MIVNNLNKTTWVMGPVETGDLTGALPEFGRWRDVQRIFGLKRGTLYRLARERKIKSITLREPGHKFGCRLFYLPSVRAFLHQKLTEQTGGEAEA